LDAGHKVHQVSRVKPDVSTWFTINKFV
jgi:hypothetical protein